MSYTGGFGIKLNIGSAPMADNPTYTLAAQVQKVGDFESSLVMAEVTGHDAVDGYEESIPSGKKKLKSLELELGLDMAQATHANSSGGLLHAHQNETLLAYQLIYPDAQQTTWTFDAYLEKFSMGAEQEKEWKGKATLKITGKPTFNTTPPAP